MPTADGCRARRRRLMDLLDFGPTAGVVLADPVHLRYLANFHVEPFSLGADLGGALVIRPDGHTTLYHDNRLPKTVDAAHVDERVSVPWYDGQAPARGQRGTILRRTVRTGFYPGRIHDSLVDDQAIGIHDIIAEMR